MSAREDAYARHQRTRWMRPDAYRWIRPDAARFLKPGSAPEDVFPGFERKYSPNQPRVPAGNPDGGQWTDSGSGGRRLGETVGARSRSTDANASPMGNVAFGDLGEAGNLGLFEITPRERDNTGSTRLAGDIPEGEGPGIGHNEGPILEPLEIPKQMPKTSAERTGFMRAAANWLVRNSGLAGEIYIGAMNNVEWLKDRQDLIQAARDEPKSYEELQTGVGLKRRGYDDHHVVEQTWAEYFGFSRRQIDDPSNVVSIPRLKHYQITGWYGAKSEAYGGLSPREYLSDKSWSERKRVGLAALIKFEILKP